MLLTLVKFNWNRIPEPESGVKSLENAEIRRVLIVPAPITLPVTFQFVPVRPAPEIGVVWKVTMEESKVKSPWNPTRLSVPLIAEVVTFATKLVTEVLTFATGKLTVTMRDGVGVGVGVGVAGVGVGVGVGLAPHDGNLKLPIRVLQFPPLVE